MIRNTTLIFIFVLTLGIMGCSSSSEDDTKASELTIYTSIYPIQYITEQIATDTAFVESVYPPGVDAHTYEPATKEITEIADSDAFIYLGAGMEGFAESVADTLKSHHVTFIELGNQEELFHREDQNQKNADHDPHIWLDPLRMIEMAKIIKNELIALTPEKKDQFTKNFSVLEENLLLLDQDFHETLHDKTEKQIIVSHAAYGYWEERYGIEQIAISGLMSGNEPSQNELTKIVDLAKKENLKYVIFEQSGSDRVSTIIQEHIGADALHIHNLEVLTDQDIDNNEDYLSLMRNNLEVLNKSTN